MRFVTSSILAAVLTAAPSYASETAMHRILRSQVLANGFSRSEDLYVAKDKQLAMVGKVVFESKRLSLNGDISCQTCHLDRFGSADGIPVAAAIHGKGEGPDRLLSGAKLLPRNTLAFWGRGAKGFDAFFWDGRVDFRGKRKISQFGTKQPSDDSLVTAAHLPVVEIREMLDEDSFVSARTRESVATAQDVYAAIAANLRKHEPSASQQLAGLLQKSVDDLTYLDYARAIAAFIRSEFRIKETKLERFAYRSGALSDAELRGGIIFYGRGKCVSCHNGAHFSDFDFHVVAFPQLGFGRNGFGIDYGRFNATFDARDLYKFRTPPLFNVSKTAPYGHSGSVKTLDEAIVAHFDPLRLVNLSAMPALARHEFYKRMTLSADTANKVGFLNDRDVSDLAAFLGTLSF